MSRYNPDQSVFVIAEAGVNHNGRPELAMELIEAASNAGADAIKFQTFDSHALVTRRAKKAVYQQSNTVEDESQRQMLERLELDKSVFKELQSLSERLGLVFMSTAFDVGSLEFLLQELALPIIKIPSGEITNGPLLLEHTRAGREVILSTGMSTLEEIEQALSVLACGFLRWENPSPNAFRSAFESEEGQEELRSKVTLLHCTTQYPAPYASVNLRAMSTLESRFGLRIGYSDHTLGVTVPIAAVALGARVIEKHITLDTKLSGPDHAASLEPDEFGQMVEHIRLIEKSLGDGEKTPHCSEMENRDVARKSLVASHPISKGERFSADNITAKRPGTGRSPMDYWKVLGHASVKDYEADELL